MNIKWILGPAGMLLLLAAAPACAWRCEHGFVDVGDSTRAVLKKCGQPDFIYGAAGKTARKHSPVLWYYDSGPAQLVRVLEFRGGMLENMDTAGYGLSMTVQACTPQDIRPGMHVYELARRCGKPLSRRTLGKRAANVAGGHVEVWTYDFGAQYLLQKAMIAGGQVQSVKTASRTPRRSKPRG